MSNKPDVEDFPAPIFQIADTLKGNQGQAMEVDISDYFDSKVPIVNSALYSGETQINIDSWGMDISG